MVEFVDEGKCARPRQPPEARLQPEDAAEGGRHPDRSVRVGSKREVAEPRRDRGGRAARGSTGDAVGVERIARRSIMGVLGGEPLGLYTPIQIGRASCRKMVWQ